MFKSFDLQQACLTRHLYVFQTTASSGVEDQTLSSTESPGSLPAFLKSQNIPYYETQTWLEMEDRVTEAQWRVVQDWAGKLTDTLISVYHSLKLILCLFS